MALSIPNIASPATNSAAAEVRVPTHPSNACQREVSRDGEHVADLGTGDFFGEMGVLSKGQRNATVEAKTDMRLLTLSHWDVERLRKSAPQVLDQLAEAIQERSESG